MPEIISGKHFKVPPTNVDHSCSQSYRARTGVCWFAEPSTPIVISDDMLRSYFAVSQEELNAFSGSGAVKPVMSEIELFGVSGKYLAPRRGEASTFTNDERVLSVGFGRDFSTGELLCSLNLAPCGFHVAQRVDFQSLPRLIEDSILLYSVLPYFWTHPSRLASGISDICFEDSEPSDDEGALGPWNFAFIPGSSLEELKSKTGQVLNDIGTPDRLWVACLRAEEPILWVTVFSMVEAGGRVLDEPVLQFNVSADVFHSLGDTPSPLRMAVFWQ